MLVESFNSTLSEKLRSGANRVDAISNVPVPVDKLTVDGLLMVVPPITEIVGLYLNHLHLYPSTIAATLVMGTTMVTFDQMARYHSHDPKMQISEWIGPGIAKGMRVTADIFDAATTNSL